MLRWKVVRCRSHDANDHEIFRVVMVPKIPKANDEGLYSFTGILMLSCGNGCQNPSRTTASPNTAGIPRLRMESLVEKHFHAQEIHEMFVVTEDVVYNNEFRVFPFMYINVAMIAKSDILGGDDVVASFSLPNMFESPGSQNKFERSRWYLLNNYLLLLSFRLAVNHCLADSCNANGTFHATCQTPPFLLNVTTQFFEEYGEANCCKWTTSTATVGKLMNERTVFGLAITQRVFEIKSVKVGAWFERVLGKRLGRLHCFFNAVKLADIECNRLFKPLLIPTNLCTDSFLFFNRSYRCCIAASVLPKAFISTKVGFFRLRFK